jgi:hypothetical protein
MFDEYTSSDKSYHTFEYNGKPWLSRNVSMRFSRG